MQRNANARPQFNPLEARVRQLEQHVYWLRVWVGAALTVLIGVGVLAAMLYIKGR